MTQKDGHPGAAYKGDERANLSPTNDILCITINSTDRGRIDARQIVEDQFDGRVFDRKQLSGLLPRCRVERNYDPVEGATSDMEPMIGLSFAKRSPAHELVDMETGFRYENVERETSGRGMTKDVDYRATGKCTFKMGLDDDIREQDDIC
ncbi:hypothetical protein K503DRAFT_835800 [Rhizopogon vinicolor AM-OR11-026]|uniref:Uncharacterized protein n=1 Tax=Rhizopogon vinicolor AM-OR11-026 TaxID=1314800 RepID=A0A1B7N9L9_9AGAM|nr:hypothetical protein K503DRAFT_835800 [Rhizopogon vinicolor AM-OR11-026]